jgi:hypothetical protein
MESTCNGHRRMRWTRDRPTPSRRASSALRRASVGNRHQLGVVRQPGAVGVLLRLLVRVLKTDEVMSVIVIDHGTASYIGFAYRLGLIPVRPRSPRGERGASLRCDDWRVRPNLARLGWAR